MSKPPRSPADGERAAVIGFEGQYTLAAKIVLARLSTLEWIRVADPDAGAADDFQFAAGGTRHAIQAKWSQYPGTFTWSRLAGPGPDGPLLGQLAKAWLRLGAGKTGPVTIHLRSNEAPSTTKPTLNTALGKCQAKAPSHFAAFIARSLNPVREALRSGLDPADVRASKIYLDWEPAWNELRSASSLPVADFFRFLIEFSIVLGSTVEEPLATDAERATELRHVAATIQSLVVDPARPVELSKDELLGQLGWTDLVRFRNPHSFPVPTIYAANRAARDALQARRSTLSGGYLALIGPAGSGKSTLLSAMDWTTTDQVCRYYAFVPDSADPLSGRGEASSFLHDLALSLEGAGIHRDGYGNDLVSQRSVIFDQLEKAGRRWKDTGISTVIIIDGLDHIPREQRPERSLLEELPPPKAIPDGVFVLLGSQTTEVLPGSISDALRRDDRTVVLPPLSPAEVSQLALDAGPGRWLTASQLERLYSCSEGHPLALTYIMQDLISIEVGEATARVRSIKADGILEGATTLGPVVEDRYRGYLQGVAGSPEAMSVLARVSRLRGPVDLRWVATWASPEALHQFESHAATFFWHSGATWRFIHNSFRLFLADATALVAGVPDTARDKMIHSELADLCAASSSDWPFYQDEELAHRLLADQHARVLETATPSGLRQKLRDLRPASTVRNQMYLAMRSAAALNDPGALAPLLFFHSELAQRDIVLEPATLAVLIARATPELGLEHVVAAGRLRIDLSHALTIALHLAQVGLEQEASLILTSAGGLSGIANGDDSHQDSKMDAFADWAEVRLRLSGLAEVLSELDVVLPLPDGPPPDQVSREDPDVNWRKINEEREDHASVILSRNVVHARCLDVLVEWGQEDAVLKLTDLIDAEASLSWRSRARLIRAFRAADDGDVGEALVQCVILSGLDAAGPDEEDDDEEVFAQYPPATQPMVPLGTRVQAALLLLRSGFADSPELGRLVPDSAQATWPSVFTGDGGLSPYLTWFSLRKFRLARGERVPPAVPPADGSPSDGRHRGLHRFRAALSLLADLEAQELRSRLGLQPPTPIAGSCDPIIRLFEIPSETTNEWSGWYAYRGTAADIFDRLIALAARAGAPEFDATLARFVEAWNDSNRADYWSPKLRSSVLASAASRCKGLNLDVIAAELSGAEADAAVSVVDSYSSVETWFAFADAWLVLNQPSRALDAAALAVASSSAVGAQDGDPQLTYWLAWLESAHTSGAIDVVEYISTLGRFASRLIAAKNTDASVSDAGAHLIGLVWKQAPAYATKLVELLCDSGVLNECHAIRSVLGAAIADPQVPILPATRAAAELQVPADQDHPDAILPAVVKRSGDTDAAEAEALLRMALAVRGASDPGPQSHGAPKMEEARVGPPLQPRTPHELLAAFQAATPGDSADWSFAIDVLQLQVPRGIATRLVDETRRLGIVGVAGGSIVAMAARAGLIEASGDLLRWCLVRTPTQAWLRNWDGGSRLSLVRAALADRAPHLTAIAMDDLTGVLTAGRLYGPFSSREIYDITSTLGGLGVVGDAHTAVELHLDEVAPTGLPMAAPLIGGTADSGAATEALVKWIAEYLGHPTWIIDFGARRALAAWMPTAPDLVQRTLADRISEGGWSAEAALMTLLYAGESMTSIGPELEAALGLAGIGPDEIIRELARRIAIPHGISLPIAAERELSPSYRILLPELPARHAPELDRQGVPFLDYSDPRQVIAPFDRHLALIAEFCEVDARSAIYRAASLANSSKERWLAGGHRAQADRLRARDQKHTYRPWAYMAGRRALGAVMAELRDAGQLGETWPAHEMRLVDTVLAGISVEPIDASSPLPWRPEGTSFRDVKGWCTEVATAARHYATSAAMSDPYVLAELSEWRSLEAGLPEEQREVRASHGYTITDGLEAPPRRAWEQSEAGASAYPLSLDTAWAHEELVVRGREYGSDVPWLEWIALHPSAAAANGWVSTGDLPFGWNGADGALRAHTVRRGLGQLSDHRPSSSSVAAVWQVVLTKAGLADLIQTFGTLRRSVLVSRSLPAHRSGGHPAEDRSEARAIVPEAR